MNEQKYKKFMTGNQAAVQGAIDAGAKIMCGYPITPATEILQIWAEEVEKRKSLKVIQAEDETASGFNTIGSIIAGEKAFTATAGPGHILMQDGLSMAEAMRLPFVGVIMQRGGPSTGTVVYGQQEVTMACYGGNGEGHRIVYSTSNAQEIYDYTIKAFDSAWRYRFPTLVLGDGYQSKMSQVVDMKNKIRVIDSKPIITKDNLNHRNCFNFESELAEQLVRDHNDFIKYTPKIVESEEYKVHDAKKVVVTHGIVSGAAREAVDVMCEKGMKVGMFRPITLQPLDFVSLTRIASRVEELLIVESSYGHFERLIKAGIYGLTKIKTLQKPVESIEPEEIIKHL